MDNLYMMGVPAAFGLLFEREPDLEGYFFALPEETQKAIINSSINSPEDDLRDTIERYRLKE